MSDSSFAPPALQLGALAVAASPTAGLGVALDANGQLPDLVKKTLPGYEYAYTEFTSNVACTASTEASANTIVTAPSVSFDGATTVWVEFGAVTWSASITTAGGFVVLFEDGAALGELWRGTAAAANTAQNGIRTGRRRTPTAGPHTYSIRGYIGAAGTFTVAVGAGGAGADMPGFIRITRAS